MKCYDCGSEMLPDAFGRNLDGTPSLPGFPGYAAGEVSTDGEVWLRCPSGHRGAWVKATQPVTGPANTDPFGRVPIDMHRLTPEQNAAYAASYQSYLKQQAYDRAAFEAAGICQPVGSEAAFARHKLGY